MKTKIIFRTIHLIWYNMNALENSSFLFTCWKRKKSLSQLIDITRVFIWFPLRFRNRLSHWKRIHAYAMSGLIRYRVTTCLAIPSRQVKIRDGTVMHYIPESTTTQVVGPVPRWLRRTISTIIGGDDEAYSHKIKYKHITSVRTAFKLPNFYPYWYTRRSRSEIW